VGVGETGALKQARSRFYFLVGLDLGARKNWATR
jgi:hypothetical protein